MESYTHRVMLAVSTFVTCQRVTMHIRNQYVGINCKLSLKGNRLAIVKDNRSNVR